MGVRLAVGLAVVLVALPGLVTPVAPLLDLPNHLARLWLLAGGVRTAPVSTMYVEHWPGSVTNLAIDLVAKAAGSAIPPERLIRGLVALAALLPAAGVALLNRAAFGGWRWWQAGLPVAV